MEGSGRGRFKRTAILFSLSHSLSLSLSLSFSLSLNFQFFGDGNENFFGDLLDPQRPSIMQPCRMRLTSIKQRSLRGRKKQKGKRLKQFRGFFYFLLPFSSLKNAKHLTIFVVAVVVVVSFSFVLFIFSVRFYLKMREI